MKYIPYRSRNHGNRASHIATREDCCSDLWLTGKQKRICWECRKIGAFTVCPECRSKTEYLDKRARPPRKRQKNFNKKWKEFESLFR